MGARALRLHEGDDIATVIDQVAAGERVSVVDGRGDVVDELVSLDDVPRFHKVALADIPEGAQVHKYGEPIGVSVAPISRGAYVHVHNIASVRQVTGR